MVCFLEYTIFIVIYSHSCNSNLKAPGPMKVVVVGSDLYISCVLRPYVDQFSSKPPDFQNHIRFLIIPLGKFDNAVPDCY